MNSKQCTRVKRKIALLIYKIIKKRIMIKSYKIPMELCLIFEIWIFNEKVAELKITDEEMSIDN